MLTASDVKRRLIQQRETLDSLRRYL